MTAAQIFHRLRFRYGKTGPQRFMSHLDLCTTLMRALNRAEIAMLYTEGFSPRPRTGFGPPLPMFVEGTGELADVDLTVRLDPADFVTMVTAQLSKDIVIHEAWYVDGKASSITAALRRAHYEITPRTGSLDVTAQQLEAFLAQPEIKYEKESKGTKKVVDLRPGIVSMTLDASRIIAVLEASPARTVNVVELLKALKGPGGTPEHYRITRLRCELDETPAPAPAPRKAAEPAEDPADAEASVLEDVG